MKNKTYGTFFSKNPANIAKQNGTVIIDIQSQSISQPNSMENIISRFPLLAVHIFKELDTKDLQTCLNVSRLWYKFINNEKFPWKRKIQSVVKKCKQKTSKKYLKTVFRKAPLVILRDFCLALENLTEIKVQNEFLPLQIAAESGMSNLCKFVMFKTENENPQDQMGFTALHMAARRGHFDVCKIIFEGIEDKNPTNLDGNTPLHFSAQNGHIRICRYLSENGMEKNSTNHQGETPFDLAESNGFFNVCIYLDPLIFCKKMFTKHLRSTVASNSSTISIFLFFCSYISILYLVLPTLVFLTHTILCLLIMIFIPPDAFLYACLFVCLASILGAVISLYS